MFNILTYGKRENIFVGIPCTIPKQAVHAIQIYHWNFLLGNTPFFNFRSLKKIPPNTKYIVGIPFYHHFYTESLEPIFKFLHSDNPKNKKVTYLSMPDRVKEDSKKGLVHWIIDYATECNQLDYESSLINFNKLCKALYTTPENITLITGAETKLPYGTAATAVSNKHGYNVVTGYSLFRFLNLHNQVEQHDTYTKQKMLDIRLGKLLKYKSLCYNRIPRHHRTVIIAHIMNRNYQDECLYSLGNHQAGPRWDWVQHFPELEAEIKKLKNGPNIYPHIAEPEVNLEVNQAESLGWNHGLNSYFQFVTETTPHNARYMFITEKSLKPFAMLQPFIQYGPKNNVKNLKLHGFEIFDKWIDHSYDDEEDDVVRLRMVLKEFDRLQNIPADRWSKMLIEMLEPLCHNLYAVKNTTRFTASSQLIPILTNFLEQD